MAALNGQPLGATPIRISWGRSTSRASIPRDASFGPGAAMLGLGGALGVAMGGYPGALGAAGFGGAAMLVGGVGRGRWLCVWVVFGCALTLNGGLAKRAVAEREEQESSRMVCHHHQLDAHTTTNPTTTPTVPARRLPSAVQHAAQPHAAAARRQPADGPQHRAAKRLRHAPRGRRRRRRAGCDANAV